MEQSTDVYVFAVVLCMPLLGWLISQPPVWLRLRPRLEPLAITLWQQVVVQEKPDDEALRRWAVLHLEQLRDHLDRVRRLILDDEWMTATRQTGNRLAHERLVQDVRDAELAVLAFGPVELVAAAPAAPTPRAAPRLSLSTPAPRSTVEVIEFGPTGRWL